jgi:hypothetical protein
MMSMSRIVLEEKVCNRSIMFWYITYWYYMSIVIDMLYHCHSWKQNYGVTL